MNRQKIADRTAEILNLYYNNEIEPFLDSCHEDVLWVAPVENQVIRGRKNLAEAFRAENHEWKFSLKDLTALPLATTSNTVVEVMTFIWVETIEPDNSVGSSVNKRMQFTWVEHKGVAKIRVVYISYPINNDWEGIYPVRYDENHRRFVLTGEIMPKRIYVKGVDKTIMHLNWSRVTYVESLGNHALIHTLDRDVESTENLKILEKRYGKLFLKCNESYLVNPAHVRSIRRSQMTITGGLIFSFRKRSILR